MPPKRNAKGQFVKKKTKSKRKKSTKKRKNIMVQVLTPQQVRAHYAKMGKRPPTKRKSLQMIGLAPTKKKIKSKKSKTIRVAGRHKKVKVVNGKKYICSGNMCRRV